MATTRRRGGNASNLTYGGRTLRVKSTLSNMDEITTGLIDVVQNFDRGVRAEVMNDVAVYILQRARHYIREGKKEALTPNPSDNTANLERDLSKYIVFEDTDKLIIDLSSIPYAALHDAPLGTSTLIGEGERMVFFWYRKGRWVSTLGGIKKPGRAFLSRSMDDAKRALPKMIKKSISDYRSLGRVNISPRTGAALRGPARTPVERRNQRMGR